MKTLIVVVVALFAMSCTQAVSPNSGEYTVTLYKEGKVKLEDHRIVEMGVCNSIFIYYSEDGINKNGLYLNRQNYSNGDFEETIYNRDGTMQSRQTYYGN